MIIAPAVTIPSSVADALTTVVPVTTLRCKVADTYMLAFKEACGADLAKKFVTFVADKTVYTGATLLKYFDVALIRPKPTDIGSASVDGDDSTISVKFKVSFSMLGVDFPSVPCKATFKFSGKEVARFDGLTLVPDVKIPDVKLPKMPW